MIIDGRGSCGSHCWLVGVDASLVPILVARTQLTLSLTLRERLVARRLSISRASSLLKTLLSLARSQTRSTKKSRPTPASTHNVSWALYWPSSLFVEYHQPTRSLNL